MSLLVLFKSAAAAAALAADLSCSSAVSANLTTGISLEAASVASSSVTAATTTAIPLSVAPTVYSDDFNRADGAPGSNWTVSGASISTNRLALPFFGYAQWTGTAIPNDRFVEVQLSTALPSGSLIIGLSGAYGVSTDTLTVSITSSNVIVGASDVGGAIVNHPAATVFGLNTTGNVIRAEMRGFWAYVYLNGTRVYQFPIPSNLTAYPPAVTGVVNGSSVYLDNFSAGGLAPYSNTVVSAALSAQTLFAASPSASSSVGANLSTQIRLASTASSQAAVTAALDVPVQLLSSSIVYQEAIYNIPVTAGDLIVVGVMIHDYNANEVPEARLRDTDILDSNTWNTLDGGGAAYTATTATIEPFRLDARTGGLLTYDGGGPGYWGEIGVYSTRVIASGNLTFAIGMFSGDVSTSMNHGGSWWSGISYARYSGNFGGYPWRSNSTSSGVSASPSAPSLTSSTPAAFFSVLRALPSTYVSLTPASGWVDIGMAGSAYDFEFAAATKLDALAATETASWTASATTQWQSLSVQYATLPTGSMSTAPRVAVSTAAILSTQIRLAAATSAQASVTAALTTGIQLSVIPVAVTDNFNRADGASGSNWSAGTISSNRLSIPTSEPTTWIGPAPADDGYAQFTIAASQTGFIAVYISGLGAPPYINFLISAGSVNSTWEVGSSSNIEPYYNLSGMKDVGTVFRFEKRGRAISMFRNGTKVMAFNVAVGSAPFQFSIQALSNPLLIDDFSVGALAPYALTTIDAELKVGAGLNASAVSQVTASANLTTGIPLSVGGSGTNLLTAPSAFDDAAWTVGSSVTLTPNAATAPDGTATADRAAMPATTSTYIKQAVTLNSGVAYTFSVYAKVVSLSAPKIVLKFQVVGGGTVYTETTFTATNLDWNQYAITYTPSATGSLEVQIDNSGFGLSGDAVDYYIWNAKVETGSAATPYSLAPIANALLTADLTTSASSGMAATPAAVASVSAGLTTGIPLASSEAVAASISAALSTQVPLAAVQGVQASATAALSTQIRLASSQAAQSAVTAALSTGIPLASTESAQASVTAGLTTAIRLVAAPAALASTTAALSTQIPLASTQAGQASVTAALTVGAGLNSAPAGQASVTAGLTTAIQAASNLAAQSSVTASLLTGTGLTSAQTVVAFLSPALSTGIPLASSQSGAASVTASLSIPKPLAATPAAQAAVGAALTTQIRLASAPAGAASVTANLSTAIALAATPAAQATATAGLSTSIRLASALASQVTIGAQFQGGAAALAATPAALSSITASLSTQIQLSAAPAASGAASGSLSTSIRLALAAASQASVGPTLTTGIPLATSSSAQAILGAGITTGIALESAPVVQVSASGNLTAQIRLALDVSGQASLGASLGSLIDGVLAGAARFPVEQPARAFPLTMTVAGFHLTQGSRAAILSQAERVFPLERNQA